jgi:type IV pilus assembly protein PilM
MSTETVVRERPSGFFGSPPPSMAIEIARGRVAAVAVTGGSTGVVVAAHAVEQLAPGIVEPALNAPNIHDRDALVRAIRSALEKIGSWSRRVALVVPDTAAKVSLVRFEKVPPKAQDLDQLIRWQKRKAVPFKIEDAQVAWVPGVPQAGGGREFLVTAARRDIIESYEQACESAGLQVGIVDLATFNVINSALAGSPAIPGDWLLVHLTADYVTLAVVRGHDLIFFRNRATGEEGELTDLVHQTAMYHEDRLGGGGFSRVVVAGAWVHGPEAADRLRRAIGERVGVRAESLDFREAVAMRDRIGANPALLDVLAPAVGVLLRERPGRRSYRGSLTGRVA